MRAVSAGSATALTLALLAALSSCATFGSAEGQAGPTRSADRAAVEQAIGELEAPAEPQAADVAERGREGRGAGPGAAPAQPASLPQQVPAEERLRVYSAELELLVGSVEQTKERVIGTAEGAGGYVESSSGEFIVIRVPAERFDEVLSEVEGFGTIRSRSVRTADVTAQYADLEGRLDLARQTRERFYTLLERTSDTEERVEILREIRRLTERIEGLEAQLESLDRLIAYSRITLRLTARISQAAPERSEIPFPWIARLDPLEQTTRAPRSRPEVDLPEDYAVFDSGRLFRAETAEGTRARIGAVANDPRGDTAFWQEALVYHLGDFYRVDRRVEAGGFRGALFEAKGASAFSYLVLVAAGEEEILVAEVFFPDADAVAERLDELTAVLSEVSS